MICSRQDGLDELRFGYLKNSAKRLFGVPMDLIGQLGRQWREERQFLPIRNVMSFEGDGLVLGAGTLLAARIDEGPLGASLDLDVPRLLALLSVAHHRPIPPSVIANIDRAFRASERGEECLAAIHLALAGLTKLDPPGEMSRRLFVAEELLARGIAPRTILDALEIDSDVLDAFVRYSPDEPRIPAGNSIESGRWTDGDQAARHSFLASLPGSAARGLAGFLSRHIDIANAGKTVSAGVAALTRAGSAFGLWLIPTRAGGSDHSGDISGAPGFSYSWNADETDLRIVHANGLGRVVVLHAALGPDAVFRDGGGRAVARIAANQVIVDIAAFPEATREAANENRDPRLCPKPVIDRPGRDKDGQETDKSRKDRAYEDQVKQLVNPGNPTPHGMGYAFFNPVRGGTVIVDDCQHKTGDVHEFKGPEYGRLIKKLDGKGYNFGLFAKWIDQAERQVEAAPSRNIIWHFADKKALGEARKLFDDTDHLELHRIRTVLTPMIGSVQ